MADLNPRIKATSKAEITSVEIKARLQEAGVRSTQDVISRRFKSCKIHKGLYWRTEAEKILKEYTQNGYKPRTKTVVWYNPTNEEIVTTKEAMKYLGFTHSASVALAAKTHHWRRPKIGYYLKSDIERYKQKRQVVPYDPVVHTTVAEVCELYKVKNVDSLRALLNNLPNGPRVLGYILKLGKNNRHVRVAYYDKASVDLYFKTRNRQYKKFSAGSSK